VLYQIVQTHFEDSLAIVFDRPDERQIVVERMDWSHVDRRGCYDKNKQPPEATRLATDPLTSAEPMP